LTQHIRNSNLALIALVISFAGLSLLPLLLINNPPTIMVPWQTPLIGILFAFICIFGIVAGVSPKHCSFLPRTRKATPTESNTNSHPQSSVEIHKKGHHPTCDYYSGHILTLRTKTLCAGCTGLVTGAMVALIGTIMFFFLGWRFFDPTLIFWIGVILVVIGLLQHLIYHLLAVHLGSVRFVMNILFVLGPFLLLASQVQLTDNFAIALYLLMLTLYWIFTRIIMSRRSHREICGRCNKIACPLRES
jgi:hypothetical protein